LTTAGVFHAVVLSEEDLNVEVKENALHITANKAEDGSEKARALPSAPWYRHPCVHSRRFHGRPQEGYWRIPRKRHASQ
jgi:hypothetical protein